MIARFLPQSLREWWQTVSGPARSLAKVLTSLLILFASLIVLHTVGTLAGLGSLHEDAVVLDSVRATNGYLTVTGTAPPLSQVEIRMNRRLSGSAWAGPDGRFRHSVELAPQGSRITARAYGPDFVELGTDDTPIIWSLGIFQPSVTLAIYLEDSSRLWVAGQAIPEQAVQIEAVDGTVLQRARTDDIGAFDILIPIDGEPPPLVVARLREPGSPARSRGSPATERSSPHTVTRASSEGLPLVRSVDIQLPDRPFDELLRGLKSGSPPTGRQAIRELLDTIEERIHVVVELPSSHPYVDALLKGFLTPTDFVTRCIGRVNVLLDDEILAALSAEQPELVQALRPQVTVHAEQTFGRVRFEQRSLFFIWLFGEGITLDPGFNGGISSSPLLASGDVFRLEFGGNPPAGFEGALPNEVTDEGAVWRGPRAPSEAQGIAIKYDALSAMRALATVRTSAATQQQRPTNVSDFLNQLEQRGRSSLLRRAWGTLLAAVPFIGLIWITYREPLGNRSLWRPLAAASLLFALWQSWDLIQAVMLEVVGPPLSLWSQVYVSTVVQASVQVSVEASAMTLERAGAAIPLWSDAGSHVFLLLVSIVIGLAPFYVEKVIEACPPGTGKSRENAAPARRTHKRSVWSVLRRVYALVLTVPLVLFFLALAFSGALPLEYAVSLQAAITRLRDFVWQVLPPPLANTAGSPEFLMVLWPLAVLLLVSLVYKGSLALFGFVQILVAGFFMFSPAIGWIPGVPWIVVAGVAGVAAYPLATVLLQSVVPSQERAAKRVISIVSALVVALTVFHPLVPAKMALVGAASVLGIGVGWVSLRTLAGTGAVPRLERLLLDSRTPVIVGLAVITAIVGWPITEAGEALRFVSLSQFMSKLDDLFAIVVAAGVGLTLWVCAKNKSDQLDFNHGAGILIIGGVFYAVFLVGATTTWAFLPVPFLVALLIGKKLLFSSTQTTSQQVPEGTESEHVEAAITEAVKSAAARSQLQAIRKTLNTKLRSTDLTPEDYEKKLADYETYLAPRESGASTPVETGNVFEIGASDPRTNIANSVRYGALLALAPVAVALYQHLPHQSVNYPFPLADFVIFLVLASAKWIFYAVFFGALLSRLRGTSGLGKGVGFFFALALPFLIYRVLGTESINEMRLFLLWAGQLFVFCTTLGFLALDYRLLRDSGFGLRDLRIIHNLPALSAFASTVIAAIVPAVAALLAGRVTDLARFFIDSILPSLSPPP